MLNFYLFICSQKNPMLPKKSLTELAVTWSNKYTIYINQHSEKHNKTNPITMSWYNLLLDTPNYIINLTQPHIFSINFVEILYNPKTKLFYYFLDFLKKMGLVASLLPLYKYRYNVHHLQFKTTFHLNEHFD